jgi:hypothetical protein
MSNEKEMAPMAGMSRAIVIGTISKTGIAVHYVTSGTPCASFTFVVTEQGQDGKEHPTFIDGECWGKRAEAAAELDVGRLCRFEGKLAKRKRGEEWTLIVSGFELQPVLTPPVARMTGNTN